MDVIGRLRLEQAVESTKSRRSRRRKQLPRNPGATVALFMPCGCIWATNYICFVYGWALGIFGDLIQDHNNKNLAIVVSIRCGANQGWVSKRILDS